MDDSKYEVRVGWYGGLVCTSEQIQMIKFQIEMEQHYKEQREEHELLIRALGLRATLIKWYAPWTWF